MNTSAAARHTAAILLNKIPDLDLERDPEGISLAHAHWMLIGIAEGYIQNDKAHRWLGYAQAIIVTNDMATLDEMKAVNQTS